MIFLNTRARLSATFKDSISGNLVDPSVVQLTIQTPPVYGAPRTSVFTYGTTPDIVRDGVGQYHYDLLVLFSGQCVFRWASVSIGQESADEQTFTAQTSKVTP